MMLAICGRDIVAIGKRAAAIARLPAIFWPKVLRNDVNMKQQSLQEISLVPAKARAVSSVLQGRKNLKFCPDNRAHGFVSF